MTIGTKVYLTLLSFSSMFLIASAVSKIVLYIDAYGLTHNRILTIWAMIIHLLVTVVILLKIYIPKFAIVKYCVAILVGVFIAQNLINNDYLIANYNVDRYLKAEKAANGEQIPNSKMVDFGILENLDSSAVPAIVKLYNTTNDIAFKDSAKIALRRICYNTTDEQKWQNYSIARSIADKEFEKLGIKPTDIDDYYDYSGDIEPYYYDEQSSDIVEEPLYGETDPNKKVEVAN